MRNCASHFATEHQASLCGGRVKVCYVNTIPKSSDDAILAGPAYIRGHIIIRCKTANQEQSLFVVLVASLALLANLACGIQQS